MKKCLVIISPSDEDYGRLITKVKHPEKWRTWESETWVVFLAGSESVFNANIFDKIAAYDKIFVARHPTNDSEILQRSPRMRVKMFSHTSGDPIWEPHEAQLVEQLEMISRNGHPNSKVTQKAVDSICDAILDREALFSEASIRCLNSILCEILKPAPSTDAIEITVQKELDDAFLRGLGLESGKIQIWIGSILSLGDSELSRLPMDSRIVLVRQLRDILLGGDGRDADGLVHLLGSTIARMDDNARGRDSL